MQRPVPDTTDRTRRTFARRAREDRLYRITLPDGSEVAVTVATLGKRRWPSLIIVMPEGSELVAEHVTPRNPAREEDPRVRDWRSTVVDNR